MPHPDMYFDLDPQVLIHTRAIYESISDLPIISPHTHIDPGMFSNPGYQYPDPYRLFVLADHYIFRMLHSQGISLETILRCPDPKLGWRLFAENYHLFLATTSATWFEIALEQVFGITEKLNRGNADALYEYISDQLTTPSLAPRQLLDTFKIEVLATSDQAVDTLPHHQAIKSTPLEGRIIPTIRMDNLMFIAAPGWRDTIVKLSQSSQVDVTGYASFMEAIRQRRNYFKQLRATACDISVPSTCTEPLSTREADDIFTKAVQGKVSGKEEQCFIAHMLFESARMCCEDGLVMQLHAGVQRNNNTNAYTQFGPDLGYDLPIQVEYVRNLMPLLREFGEEPNFTLLLFTLDEASLIRELAPLAGVYPSLRLGPPWWFLDSWQGIRNYLERTTEIAGIYNTVGFIDDGRNLLTLPARHDLWRRAVANWLGGLVDRHVVQINEALEVAQQMSYQLAKKVYHL
jgi:glucuronate isomerase